MDEKTKMLLEAAKEGNDAGVLRALELGADVNAMRPLTSLTALLLALEWNHFATPENLCVAVAYSHCKFSIAPL